MPTRLLSGAAAIALLASCVGAPGAGDAGMSAEIRRTAYGVPHIKADDYAGIGYGFGANTAGNVYVLPVTGPDTFGTPARLNDGAAMPMAVPVGNADSYPTWTPDSAALVFAHGNSSRSENGFRR